MCQPQINPDHLFSLGDDGRRKRHDDMQPPSAILALDQVCRIYGQSSIRGSIIWQGKRDRYSSSSRGESHGVPVPGQRVRMCVVPWGTMRRVGTGHGTSSFVARKRRFESFGRLHTRLNDEIGDQARAGCFYRIVRGVMQPHAILFVLCPAVGADVIKGSRELTCGVRQRLCLFWCRLQGESDGSLHTVDMPYTARFCNIKERKDRGKGCPADAGRAFLCRLRSAVPYP